MPDASKERRRRRARRESLAWVKADEEHRGLRVPDGYGRVAEYEQAGVTATAYYSQEHGDFHLIVGAEGNTAAFPHLKRLHFGAIKNLIRDLETLEGSLMYI